MKRYMSIPLILGTCFSVFLMAGTLQAKDIKTESMEPVIEKQIDSPSAYSSTGQEKNQGQDKVPLQYGQEVLTYEERVDPIEYETLFASETLAERSFRVYKKNTKVGFVWMPMKNAVSYKYKIINAKTGKTLKNVNTKKLTGFFSASSNKNKATYKLYIYGIDKNGKSSSKRMWTDYFHTGGVVVTPKLLRWCGITFKEDQNLLGTVKNEKFTQYILPKQHEDPDVGGYYIDE